MKYRYEGIRMSLEGPAKGSAWRVLKCGHEGLLREQKGVMKGSNLKLRAIRYFRQCPSINFNTLQ